PMADFGVKVPDGLIDGDELRRIVPALTDHINAGYVVTGDHSVDPRLFVDSLGAALRSRGVRIIENAPLESVVVRDGSVRSVTTREGAIAFDEIVLSPGSGSRPLGRKFGLRIPVIPGQGYNVALPVSAKLGNPVIFEEAHAVATPFADRI